MPAGRDLRRSFSTTDAGGWEPWNAFGRLLRPAFIETINRFAAGGGVRWPKPVSKDVSLLGAKVRLGLKRTGNRFTRTPQIIDLRRRAKALIRPSAKAPDLNAFVVTPRAINANDITEHLVVLKLLSSTRLSVGRVRPPGVAV